MAESKRPPSSAAEPPSGAAVRRLAKQARVASEKIAKRGRQLDKAAGRPGRERRRQAQLERATSRLVELTRQISATIGVGPGPVRRPPAAAAPKAPEAAAKPAARRATATRRTRRPTAES